MDAMISALEASQVAFTYVTYSPNRRYDQKLTDLLQIVELQPLEHGQSRRRRECIVWRSGIVADMDHSGTQRTSRGTPARTAKRSWQPALAVRLRRWTLERGSLTR
jgi:hypothetical protein